MFPLQALQFGFGGVEGLPLFGALLPFLFELFLRRFSLILRDF